jgi:hypothetical protein
MNRSILWTDPWEGYETRTEAEIKALRYNKGKLRYDLLPWEWKEGLTQVLQMGAEKYDDNNWRKGMSNTDIMASLERHLIEYQKGSDNDGESNLHHMLHVAWNALAIYYFDMYNFDNDNRFIEVNKNGS